jgi:hypothetical protein
MITGILFILFFILLAAAITGIVLFAVKAHKVQSSWDELTRPDRWGNKAPEVPVKVEKDYDRKMHRAKVGLLVQSLLVLLYLVCLFVFQDHFIKSKQAQLLLSESLVKL